jgi:hypothetical protein
MDITIRVELHFRIDRAHAEAAGIEIEIKSKLKWPQMKAKWATLTSPNVSLCRSSLCNIYDSKYDFQCLSMDLVLFRCNEKGTLYIIRVVCSSQWEHIGLVTLNFCSP